MADEPTPDPQAESDSADVDAGQDTELVGLDDHVTRYIERLKGEAATYRSKLRATEEQYEGLQRKYETEQEKRDREIGERERAAGRADRDDEVAGLKAQLLDQRIKVRAGGRFADPDDAPLYVDRAKLASVDARNLDAAIDKQLGDVLEQKAHLAVKQAHGVLVTQGGRSEIPNGRPRERSWLRG